MRLFIPVGMVEILNNDNLMRKILYVLMAALVVTPGVRAASVYDGALVCDVADVRDGVNDDLRDDVRDGMNDDLRDSGEPDVQQHKRNRLKKTSTDANMFGHVVDKESGEHLPFIFLTIKGTTISTSTDPTGHYDLKNLPVGKYVVEVSAIGYRTVSREVELKKDQSLEVNFELVEDRINLDGVVVSASRSETTRRQAPTLVNVMTMDLYQKVNASNLSRGLDFQPGVRVETNCQNCGFKQVRLNGLDGPYTQILIDSRPVFSSLAGVYGIEQLPANMVDRIEVMRGGGSALFGSSAIAGTINIITKEPVRNSASISHVMSNINGSRSFDNNTQINASLVSDDNKLGIAVFGQNREQDGWDADGDGFTELTKIKGQTIGFRGYIKTGMYSKLTAEYHHLSEFRRGGDSLNLPPHEAMIAEQIKHSINTGGLKYDWFSPNEKHRVSTFASVQHIARDSYYGGGKDPNAYGYTKDFTWVLGAQYIYKFDKCLFMPADLTAGIEYNEDYLNDNLWGYNRLTKQTVRIGSAYLQNEWKNDKFGFLIGGRLDKHNMIRGVIFSPRANVRYNPIENINLRLSYSYGFRAPQAFSEDLHVDNVGGTIAMIRINPNLKVEKSQSLSLSSDMYYVKGDFQVNGLAEVFYSHLGDVFALRDIGYIYEDDESPVDPENPDDSRRQILIKERYNESGANVVGGNFEINFAWKDKIQLQAGMTAQSSMYNRARKWSDDENVAAEKRMFRTPMLYGFTTLSYSPVKDLMMALSGTFTGSMLTEHHAGGIDTDGNVIKHDRTEKTPVFADINFKISYDFELYKGIFFELNAGVQNIFNSYQKDFDRGPDRDANYIYGPAMPRNYFFGVKLHY